MVQIKNVALTFSIEEASALFNIPLPEFTRKYIYTRRVFPDRLHQLPISQVLKIYDGEKLGPWSRYRRLDF